MKLFFTTILTLLLTTSIFAEDKKNQDDVDYVALATVLFKDGYYARANDALQNVDLSDENIDKVQYYTLQGFVKAQLSMYKESNKNFYLSIEAGQKEPSIYLYIAQNSFKLKEYQKAIDALDKVNALVLQKPKLMALKAECYFQLKEYDKALDVMADINTIHPKYYDAYRQRFAYYISLNLYQSALQDAQIYLNNAEPNEKVLLSFIGALRQAKELKKATLLAEKAHLKYEKNVKIVILLATLYIDQDMIHPAADLFDKASLLDSKYLKDSSEMFRRAKEYVQALYKNSQVLDPKQKYKQKVAIYLEYGNYEKVISTRSALQRNTLLKDQNILYALAYSYYITGDFDESEKLLKQITDSELFKKGVELRKNMNKCKNNHWECTL
ncbi:tetratricopeptide repeat protein [Sulfurimonas sp.]|uniref:tetratricopeptide repeat protein n=1 Tax=Sulfurimonas sp. TaxID=2022749 RepID=UPI003D13415D